MLSKTIRFKAYCRDCGDDLALGVVANPKAGPELPQVELRVEPCRNCIKSEVGEAKAIAGLLED